MKLIKGGGCIYAKSVENYYSDDSLNNNDDPVSKEFLVYRKRGGSKLVAHVMDLQRWPVKELHTITTERPSAIILRTSKFHHLYKNFEFSNEKCTV